MIRTNFIQENEKTIAVILDYEEYQRLKRIEEDYQDYCEAARVKRANTTWVRHEDLKHELGL